MTDTNGDNGNGNGGNGGKNGLPHEPEENLDLEELEEGEEEDDEPTLDEYLASLFTEMAEEGIPVRVFAHPADPLVQPLLKRIEMQNAVLADIAKSLRAIAKREVDAPFDVSIQLKKVK